MRHSGGSISATKQKVNANHSMSNKSAREKYKIQLRQIDGGRPVRCAEEIETITLSDVPGFQCLVIPFSNVINSECPLEKIF